MDRYEIEARIKEMISEEFGVKRTCINNADNLRDDLGADSLDLVELLMQLEEYFGIEISDEDADRIKTVDDVIFYVTSAKV